MPSAAQTFAFTLSGTPVSFRLVSFAVTERLSEPYDIQLGLVSETPDIDPAPLIGLRARLDLLGGRAGRRGFHGVVVAFEQGDTPDEGDRHQTPLYHYAAVVRPELALLELRSDCRVFQRQTTDAIVRAVLEEAGIPADGLSFRTRTAAPERAYCVQYHETDLAFVQRLLAEEGWWYAFAQDAGREVMVVLDANDAAAPIVGNAVIAYRPLAGGASTDEHVHRFRLRRRAASSGYTLADYDFTHPAFRLRVTARRGDDDGLALYEPHGRHFTEPRAAALAAVRLEAARRDMHQAHGESNVSALAAGALFTLAGSERPGTDGSYLLVAVTHVGSQPQALEEHAGEEGSSYANHFAAVPRDLPFRPAQAVKPVVGGPQSAVVVGPPGEEIHVDAHGRVRVQFYWDRRGKADSGSSCWVRVSQNWAGTGFGGMFIPRVGQEVIVDFFEGDPDRPVITGRVYNATQRPPYELPRHKTRSTLKTSTHKGQGFNELRFEDLAGQEQIYQRAQKDFDRETLNDETARIDRDSHLLVRRNALARIDGNRHHSVGADRLDETGGDHHATVRGDALSKVGGSLSLTVDGDLSIKAGGKITLQAGGAFVTIDASGVAVTGPQILLNSGGSPNSPAAPKPPDPPHGCQSAPPPDATAFPSPQAEALRAARRNALPFCERCARKPV